jgi:beta-1,4-mannosyl-glycoprotein beta-1,4-N-acetylglucosaminyltransferase
MPNEISMPRVFDCFPFFNELDILEIRLAELDPLVDYFVIVEATRTFSAKPKALHFADNRSRYGRYADKIIHVVVDDMPLDAPTHWDRETHQREAIMRGLGGAHPDDRIVISDCDEIPKPDILRRALQLRGLSRRLVAFWCVNYFFRLNLRNDEHDHRLGPRLVTMNNLKSPQLLREIPLRFSQRKFLRPLAAAVASNRASRRLGKLIWPTIFWDAAWHFTAIGDVDMVNLKLSSGSHAGEYPDFTEEDLRHRRSVLTKVPLSELPEIIRQDKFSLLMD